MKIEIKNRFNGVVIFSHDVENNNMRITVEAAIKQGAKLYGANLSGADLWSANLRSANLSGADLYGADLRSANLRSANLSGADLSGADLSGANLYGADLRSANLRSADLWSADLSGTDLSGANLYGANLSGANLRSADLWSADNMPYVAFACPSDGAFIGWKKVKNYIIKLQIPESAKRCSATTNKCRCSEAVVLEIRNKDTDETIESIINTNYASLEYEVGETVKPDSFDENRWNECSHGIHFFIDKQDAINY